MPLATYTYSPFHLAERHSFNAPERYFYSFPEYCTNLPRQNSRGNIRSVLRLDLIQMNDYESPLMGLPHARFPSSFPFSCPTPAVTSCCPRSDRYVERHAHAFEVHHNLTSYTPALVSVRTVLKRWSHQWQVLLMSQSISKFSETICNLQIAG